MQSIPQKIALLEKITDNICLVYKSAELWAQTYRKDSESFNDLMKMELLLERKLKKYLKEVSKRASDWVDWNEYMLKALKLKQAAVTVTSTVTHNGQDEVNILINILYDPLVTGMVAGANAQEAITSITAPTALSSAIEKSARTQAASLAKDLSDTTLTRVRDSIATSLTLGETVQDATKRLQETINDPDRAALIARTESVNSYNSGILDFGKQTNAKTKTWEAFPGACPICEDLDGEEVLIDENFSSGDDSPPAHPNCRCAMYLSY